MLISNLKDNRLALMYAHRLNGAEWRERVVKGWQLIAFRRQLRQRVLRFQFTKIDGSLRIAYGTLNWTYIPSSQRPKGIVRRDTFTTITYYDLVRNEWRSFCITTLDFTSIRPCHAVWVPDEEEPEKER